MNFKLNASEDLLILPDFWVMLQNADGCFNDSNKLIFQTVEPFVEFDIIGTYKLNF